MLTTLIITLSSCIGAADDIYANSTNSIQAAVNSANSGDVIIVEPGTYSENILISNSKTNLVIRSESGNPADTIITASNSSFDVVTIQDTSYVTIKGLKITGAGTDKAGVYLLRSTNCIIENNVLHNDALGVFLKASPNNVVRNNIASKDLNIGEGRGFNIEQSDYTNISGNTVSNQRYGIYVSDSMANTVSGNTVNLSKDDGIRVQYATNVTVENNNINSNGQFGIYLSSSGESFLKSNNVFNSTNNSINLVSSSGNTITGNTVSDDAIASLTHAIFMNTSHNNNLQSNTVSNNDYGIAMRYSNNNTLVNNNAHNNNKGIYLTLTSSANTLSGNQANSNLMSGIVLDNAGSDNKLINNIVWLNTENGIALWSSSNNYLTNNNASQNRRGIYLSSSSSGNTLSGNKANSNSGTGIVLDNVGSNNNLISNTASSNSNYGIYLINSSNSNLVSNTASSNSKGIYVKYSNGSMISNNILSDNTADVNNSNGIMLSYSNGNVLYMNTADNNVYGISLDSSQNNNVSSNSVTSSIKYGLFLCSRSTNNLIFNNYLNNTFNTDNKNTGGIWNTTKAPGASIVGGSYIGGNYWATPLGTGFSQLNANNDADGDGIINSKYDGDNLVDYYPLVAVSAPEPAFPVADFIANPTSGSAPLSVSFTDRSQNATSRSWNFGDGATSTDTNPTHSYSLAGNYTVNLTVRNLKGTDSKTAVITVSEEEGDKNDVLPVANFETNVTSGYAPLSVLFTDRSQDATSRSWDFGDGVTSTELNPTHTYSLVGTYPAKLTVSNANGTTSKTILIAVERKSSGGSGSGGGGGGSPEFSRNIEAKELSQVFITNGKAVKFDFTKAATCVVYVSFDAKKTAGKITTIAEMLKGKSSLVSELPSGEVYKSFNLWVGNGGFATSNNIENPVVCFKVEKAWIQDKKIDRSSIVLNRYSDKKWVQLPVSLSGEDDKYLYFTAETPGFSSFAITGKANTSPEETVTEIQPDDESGNSEKNTEDTGSEAAQEPGQEENSTPGFEMVYGVAGLLAVFLYKRK
ncbi:cell surface protein [Methanosarcina sp. 2.H.A.1B.4]|nr:cell surface protein [Methanosarcina sp. 2.H.A.1B.4]